MKGWREGDTRFGSMGREWQEDNSRPPSPGVPLGHPRVCQALGTLDADSCVNGTETPFLS